MQAESVRDKISKALHDYICVEDEILNRGRKFSLSRVVDQLTTARTVPHASGFTPRPGDNSWFPPTDSGLRDGLEHEVCVEAARAAGESFNQKAPIIPWAALAGQRDLTAASASTGGYLTSTSVGSPLQVLAPFSVVAKLATVLPGLKGDLQIPVTLTEPTAAWQSTESTAFSAGTPSLGTLSFTPRTVISMIEYSHQMKLQAEALDDYLRRLLLSRIGRALDVACLQGSGASGQITGLVGNPSCTAVSGTSLDLDDLLVAQALAANADCDDGGIAVLTTPNVRALLGKREAVTGNGGFLWTGGRCGGVPGYVTTTMPALTMIVGDFANLLVGIFGAGIELAVNEGGKTSADFIFATGKVQVRALLMADAAARAPASFTVATSIT